MNLSFNVTRFRNEMRGEFFKMESALQHVTQETVSRGFDAAVNESPIQTGYLHYNWGIAIGLGAPHKILETKVDKPRHYKKAEKPNLSSIRWNSAVELYNDTWYASEANDKSSRSGFYEYAKGVMWDFVFSEVVNSDWMKKYGNIPSRPSSRL